MGKFTSSGPDWRDVHAILIALGELHQVDVSLTMLPDGASAYGSLQIIATAWRKHASVGGARRSVSRKHPFPSSNHADIWSACMKLLYELDRDCSAMWEQKVAEL